MAEKKAIERATVNAYMKAMAQTNAKMASGKKPSKKKTGKK